MKRYGRIHATQSNILTIYRQEIDKPETLEQIRLDGSFILNDKDQPIAQIDFAIYKKFSKRPNKPMLGVIQVKITSSGYDYLRYKPENFSDSTD
jgi:hypothetical protein